MNLSEPFIRRPVMTTLLMIALFVFGIIAYTKLPVSDLPNVDYPTIQVSVDYPGGTPTIMASNVVSPLEREFATIDGVTALTSQSSNGSATITLQFVLDKSLDAASTDVEAAITRAQPLLPSDLPHNPTYKKVNPSATPVYYLALVSPSMSLSDLYDYGYTYIGQRLSMVEGVSQVIIYGSPYAARVKIDPEKIASMQVGIDDVATAVQSGNVSLATGSMYAPKTDYEIDVDGQLLRATNYDDLVVKARDGSLVKISQIGKAADSQQNDKYTSTFLSKATRMPTIILAIQRLPGANTVQVVDGVKSMLPSLQQKLPSSLSFYELFDRSISIQESVKDVQTTLTIAFVLVLFVIFFFLGKFTNTFIPSLALPLSLVGTFSFMLFFHFNIDILSLLSLTLSIGFLVDDAIVVLENNVRHVQMGTHPFQASLEGSKEISTTVLSMTLCLACVFIPMVFMGGVVGRLFFEFSITIITAVLLSGVVSLTLTPLLCSRWIPPYEKGEKKTKMEVWSDKINERLISLYRTSLLWSLSHKVLVLSVGVISLFLSLWLAVLLPKDFLPESDLGFLVGYTEADDKVSPYQMEKYQSQVVEKIADDPALASLVSVTSYGNYSEGFFFIPLKDYKERGPIDPIVDRLLKKSATVPGINSYFTSPPLLNLQTGASTKALYQYALSSMDQEQLNRYASEMQQQIKTIPGITQVSSDLKIRLPRLAVSLRRDRASDLNITAKQIENFFSLAYSEKKTSSIQTPINQYDVIVQVLPEFSKNPQVLSSLYIRSANDRLVPLSEVVDVKESVGPLTINHLNGLPSATISFNIVGTSLGTAISNIDQIAKKTLPQEITGLVQGTADVFRSAFATLPFLFLLTVFIIYIVLGILYENFLHPLTVMSALPPSIFGALLTLWIFGDTLSLFSFVGIIMLIGIVMKNGIMMVDFAIEAENKGKSAYDAIIEACLVRFRPILMTTVCAFMGALPIALGVGGASAQGNKPLGLVIVGGLMISQIVTLFLTPIIYLGFEALRKKKKSVS